MTFAEAMRILGALERHGVAYVLVGSMAMAAQGIVRATRDIDVFVSPDESNVDRLKAALKELFDDPEIDRISAGDLAGDYPAIQYAPPATDYWIDILARLAGAGARDRACGAAVPGLPVCNRSQLLIAPRFP